MWTVFLQLILSSYGERPLGVLTYKGRFTNMDPLAVDEPFRLLRRSRILIGQDSTIEYRSVFFRFVLLRPVSLSRSVWSRRRFLAVDLTTEYPSSWNLTILIGVTVFGTFWAELDLVRAGEEDPDCLLGVLRPGDGVRDCLLGVDRLLRRGEDGGFLGELFLFLGVDLRVTGDLLLVRDLKA